MKKNFNWRIGFILFVIIAFGAAIIGRLFFLQILERKLYEAQALGQQTAFNSVVGSRGQIFCENSQETKGAQGSGEIKSLAINKDSWAISASIKDIPDKDAFADLLSKSIGQSKEQILSELSSKDSYVVLKKSLSSKELDKIKALNLKGLSWQNAPERFYPQGGMASQDLGFLGGAGSGQYGIEGYYEDILKGKSGIQEKGKGLKSILSDGDQISLDGSDIYLTIDYNIQFQAENLLRQEQKKNDIDSGQIIVIKPDTGRILALANFPDFDPNQYSKENDLDIFQNSATQKLFEPGSIMKPFTMAAAINEGKITPDTTYVDTGILSFGTKSIHNFANEVYGKQTMTQVLENSINTGAVFAEQQISHKMFFDYIDKFGFTSKTGVDLQGEVYSQNSNLKNGNGPDMDYATVSFGQGIELTPMQIIKGFCAIANGGKLVRPYIVEKIVNGKDEVYTRQKISEPIVSKQTLTQLNSMLINVVDKGFGGVAKIPGYYLAGKTGTAQVPLVGGRGYDPDKTIQSFVGYGPAFNPQFLILVKLDDPKVSKSALSAVPIFKDLARYIINYWQIPPDYDPTQVQPASK
ncbi:MAG: penicillin-binding protein 2 [Candidatus Staskawiczbacteria bacterium]|nr:penicillin-binding protein 2 [Candidatus Staskawiczbacteria bacterium]